MAMAHEWDFKSGTARVFPASSSGIAKPVILAGMGEAGATDLAVFEAGVDHSAYSLLAALHGRGLDLILVGYRDGNDSLGALAETVQKAMFRAISEQRGSVPLAVGGIGRGALAARYALAKMETQRMDHHTAVYFSYNGTVPTEEEASQLKGLGEWPRLPRLLGLASGDFTNELDLDIRTGPFNDSTTGARNPGGP